MRRFLVTVVAAVVGVLGLSVTPAAAEWACVGIDYVDLGVCVDDPLPERLPLP